MRTPSDHKFLKNNQEFGNRDRFRCLTVRKMHALLVQFVRMCPLWVNKIRPTQSLKL